MADLDARPALTGNAALRHITAELLGAADALGIELKSLTVGLYLDRHPSEASVWTYSYEDAQALADFYGVGNVVHYNSEPLGGLIYLGRAIYDRGAPTIAGVRMGLRLVCDSPVRAADRG